jgi:Uma2 family endonuclease
MTEEEFLRLPDDGRKYELVDGVPKTVPTSWKHDIIASQLLLRLMLSAGATGYFSTGQAGFRMKVGNIRCPDISFTRKSRLPNGVPGEGFGAQSPDLCIEVISPSEDVADMQLKVGEYFASGATLVWQLIPEEEIVHVFTSPTEFQTLAADDTLEAGDLIPDFSMRVGDLFILE